MAAGFSPEVEEEFLSCEAEYNFTSQSVERCSEHDSSSEEEEMSVDHHMPELARLELPGPSISESSSEVDAVSRMDKLESQRVNKMVNETCGCKLGPKGTACSPQFSRDVITEQRDNCAELSKEALDMLVLGQFQAQGADTGSPDASRQKYITFFFKGKRICRKFFMFLHLLSLKKYRNLLEHHQRHGVCPREHHSLHTYVIMGYFPDSHAQFSTYAIQFCTLVDKVEPVPVHVSERESKPECGVFGDSVRWKLTSRSVETGVMKEKMYDAVLVCTG